MVFAGVRFARCSPRRSEPPSRRLDRHLKTFVDSGRCTMRMRTDSDTRPNGRRRCLAAALAALLACLAALTLAAGASATPAWVTPATTLSATGGNTADVALGLDARRRHRRDLGSRERRYEILQASTRLASSGSWQTPVDLSEAGHSAASPSLAVDSSGDAVAVWRRSSGSNEIIQAAVREGASGSWQTPVNLSAAGDERLLPDGRDRLRRRRSRRLAALHRRDLRDPGDRATRLDRHLADAGHDQRSVKRRQYATAGDERRRRSGRGVWDQLIGGHQLVKAATLQAPSGSWQPPVTLAEAGWNSFGPQVALSSDGDAAVVWRRTNGASGEFIQANVRPVSTGSLAGADRALGERRGRRRRVRRVRRRRRCDRGLAAIQR